MDRLADPSGLRLLLLSATLLIGSPAAASGPPWSSGLVGDDDGPPAAEEDSREASAAWAVRDVSVVPMDRPGVLEAHTVVIENGVISRLGPSEEVEVPPGIEVLDGRGLWLLPGLVDTHVHVDDPGDLLLYLVNGVTTVVNLRGSPRHLQWRRELASGERLGPRLLTCGRFLRGPRLELGEIRERVREIAAAGYDCVKIYDDWELEAYRRVAAATREVEILFMGHAPRKIGLGPVLEEGRQRIVHLEELVYATPALDAWIDAFGEEDPPPEADPAALDAEIRELAESLAEAGIRVAATEIVIDTYLARSTPEGMARLAERPYTRYLDPFRRRQWAGADEENRLRFRHQVELQHRILHALRRAGVAMALGTDASSTGSLLVMPGWSVHEELAILVDAGGFTPYEALRQATLDAFAFLERAGGGVVAKRAPADLLFLRENPLLDIASTREIDTVVVAGKRYPIAELETRLETRRAEWGPLEAALGEIETIREEEGARAEADAWLRLARELPAWAEEVESLVNRLGYDLLSGERYDDAIAVLGANARAFPRSANAWDSLAEAHLEKGDRDEAIRLYRRALEVDPEFAHAEHMLRELGAGPDR